MLDLVSDGRVEFGTGRSSTRAEIEGFGLDPHETREMWDEALQHIVGIWTNDEYSFDGKYWQMPPRRVHPKPVAEAAPADLGRDVERRRPLRDGQARDRTAVVHGRQPAREPRRAHRELPPRPGRLHTSPSASSCNDTAATFTMVHCSDTNEKARAEAEESFVWYPGPPAITSRRSRSGWTSAARSSATTATRARRCKGEQAGYLRPLEHGLPLRQRRRCGRRPRSLHRDLQALRGGRLRAAVLPA